MRNEISVRMTHIPHQRMTHPNPNGFVATHIYEYTTAHINILAKNKREYIQSQYASVELLIIIPPCMKEMM